MDQQSPFNAFLISWIVLIAVSYLFFVRYMNYAVKKAVWPYYLIFIGATFLAFAYFQGVRGPALYLMVIAAIVILYFNFRQYGFCPGCGRSVQRKRTSCPVCGAKLE